MRPLLVALSTIAVCQTLAGAQTIDFETVPGVGTPSEQPPLIISDQYDVPPFNVTFELLDAPPGTGPQIAEVGSPARAFLGAARVRPECGVTTLTGDDMPADGQGVGCFFLTDDGQISDTEYGLKVGYSIPVFQASGVLLDVDGGNNQEVWQITARRADSTVIMTDEIRYDDADAGDGLATPWSFDSVEEIHQIWFEYQGMGTPGLAFDNFSTSSLASDLSLTKIALSGEVTVGDTLSYDIVVANGGPGPASGVLLEDTLPPGVSFLSALPSQGTCVHLDGVVTCDLGAISDGSSANVMILGRLDQVFVVNSASVSAVETDVNYSNNAASASSEVLCNTTVDAAHVGGATVGSRLYQNRPNPFRPNTKISFRLSSVGVAVIDIFDVSGRRVRRLGGHSFDPGMHSIQWDGLNSHGESVSSGTYFYELRVDGRSVASRKALVLR